MNPIVNWILLPYYHLTLGGLRHQAWYLYVIKTKECTIDTKEGWLSDKYINAISIPKFLYAPLKTKLHTTLRNNCMQEITQLYYFTATCFLLVSLHDFKEEKIVADLYLYLRDVKIFLYRQKIWRILKCIPCFSKKMFA